MFETIFYGSLVKSRGGIPERSKTVGSVLTKSAFKIGSTTIKNLSIAFLHPISEDSYKAISIGMKDLSLSIEDAIVPLTIDFDLP